MVWGRDMEEKIEISMLNDLNLWMPNVDPISSFFKLDHYMPSNMI